MVTDNETGRPILAAHITGVSIYVNSYKVPFDIFTDRGGKASSGKYPILRPLEYTL
jgi:hypothetical protein